MTSIPPDMVASLKVMADEYRLRHCLPRTERVTLSLPDHFFPVDPAVVAELETANVRLVPASELGLVMPLCSRGHE